MSTKEALAFAMKAHDGQSRRGSGLPYITHPISVYAIVKKYKESKNIEAIMQAAILHDTVEDCDVTYQQIADQFGCMTAGLVAELTNDEAEIERLGKEAYINRKLLMLTSYGLVIKLADMLDNASDNPSPHMMKRIQHHIDFLQSSRVLSRTQSLICDQIQILLEEYK